MVNIARYKESERRMWGSVGLAPTEWRLHLRRTGVSLRVQEVGQGVPLLFLHGASNSGTSWAMLVCRLEGFRCLLVDKPGSGLSDTFTEPFADFESFDAFADEFISDLLDSLELSSSSVVSTSAGGYLALRSAAAHPERTDRIVEFGWTLGAPTGKLPLVMRLASAPMIGRIMTSLPAPERAVRSMFKQIGLREALAAGRISQEAIDSYRSLLNDTNTMRNELQAGPRIISSKGMDERIYLTADTLSKVQAPVYFLWGENDPFGGADVARDFVARIPNAELELMPNAGHAVWLDDPDKAALVTTRFLATSDTSPAR